MWYLQRPDHHSINRALADSAPLDFNYHPVGNSRVAAGLRGFQQAQQGLQLGQGAATFEAAAAALRGWEMFRIPGVQLCWENAPIVEGVVVGVLARVLGCWLLNPARLLYVIEEPRRFGFGYGTLPGHVLRGEERFLVEWRPDDSVWYSIFSFSRPQHPLARLGRGYVRTRQRHFAQASLEAMQQAVVAGRPATLD